MKNQKVNAEILAINPSNIRCERNNYFGKTLREIRREKRLTQEEVSNKLGMSQKMWSSYEVGKSRPNLDTIILIAKGLEINPFDLLSRSLLKSKYFVDFKSVDTNQKFDFKKDISIEQLKLA